VYTSTEEQIKRAMERDGISRELAEKRIHAQFPLKEKLKVADYTINSSGSFQTTRFNTLEVFHLMKRDLNLH
jgi:dephospho-CoA kinase